MSKTKPIKEKKEKQEKTTKPVRLPMRSVRTGKMHLRRLLKLRIIGC